MKSDVYTLGKSREVQQGVEKLNHKQAKNSKNAILQADLAR